MTLAGSLALGVMRARKRRGLSQDDLSIAAGMSRTQLQRIESGKSGGRNDAPADPHLSTILKLAAALGVPPAALLFPPDDPAARVAVVPNSSVEMYKAYGWFIGAGGPIGLTHDRAYVPDGTNTDQSMRGMLQLLELEERIAGLRFSIAQAEGFDNLPMSPEVREILGGGGAEVEAMRTTLASLEHARTQILGEGVRSGDDDG